MADALYVAMNGAAARAEQLDSIADNLANAETPGFKAARPAFESFLPASGSGEQQFPAAVGTGVDLRSGPRQHTGNPLDIALADGTYLAVQHEGEANAITRDGRLTIDPNGTLTASGHPVLGASGAPIVVPQNAKVELDANGRVLANGAEIDRLGLFNLEGGARRISSSVLAPAQNAQLSPSKSPIAVGELEKANFGALEATVEMVNAQRQFEASMQAIDVYRKLADKSDQLGIVR